MAHSPDQPTETDPLTWEAGLGHADKPASANLAVSSICVWPQGGPAKPCSLVCVLAVWPLLHGEERGPHPPHSTRRIRFLEKCSVPARSTAVPTACRMRAQIGTLFDKCPISTGLFVKPPRKCRNQCPGRADTLRYGALLFPKSVAPERYSKCEYVRTWVGMYLRTEILMIPSTS